LEYTFYKIVFEKKKKKVIELIIYIYTRVKNILKEKFIIYNYSSEKSCWFIKIEIFITLCVIFFWKVFID